jgi:hypothetical protein
VENVDMHMSAELCPISICTDADTTKIYRIEKRNEQKELSSACQVYNDVSTQFNTAELLLLRRISI